MERSAKRKVRDIDREWGKGEGGKGGRGEGGKGWMERGKREWRESREREEGGREGGRGKEGIEDRVKGERE